MLVQDDNFLGYADDPEPPGAAGAEASSPAHVPALQLVTGPPAPAAATHGTHFYTQPAITPDPKDTVRLFYQYNSSSASTWWHKDLRDDDAVGAWLRHEKTHVRFVARFDGSPLPAITYDTPPPEGCAIIFNKNMPVVKDIPVWRGDR